jgi:hypothetical protein
MRQIDAGQTTLQADPGTARTSLGAMQTVADSEYGAIYVDFDGSFVFKDRLTATASIGGTPTLFADDGTGISYANAMWKLDDTLIFNSAQISRAGGSPHEQPVINQVLTSISSTAYNLQDLLMQTDAVALKTTPVPMWHLELRLLSDAMLLNLIYTPPITMQASLLP